MPLSVTQSPCPYNFHRLKPIVLPLTYCPPYSSLCYTDCSPCLPLSHTDWSPCPLLSHRLLPMPTSLTQLLFTPMLHRLLTMPPFLHRLLPELTLSFTHTAPHAPLSQAAPHSHPLTRLLRMTFSITQTPPHAPLKQTAPYAPLFHTLLPLNTDCPLSPLS